MMDASEYRIWQRVQEGPRQEALGEALYRMALNSLRAMADYRRLYRRDRAQGGQSARLLEQWEGENLGCIRGLFFLTAGKPLRSGKQEPERHDPDGNLLYRRALEQLQEYTALSAQPHFGVVFGEMARRQSRICETLVRNLGECSGQ